MSTSKKLFYRQAPKLPFSFYSAWGLGTFTTSGALELPDNNSLPYNPDNGSYIRISASEGDAHTLAIRSNGALFVAGNNSQGQLGDQTRVDATEFRQISGTWTEVAAGALHSLGLKTGGTLWTWGLNQSGQLGDSTAASRSSPVQISAPNYVRDGWTSFSGGGALFATTYTVAVGIKNDGRLYAWGSNSRGVVTGSLPEATTGRSSPSQVSAGPWADISFGSGYFLAKRNDGTLWACGFNNVGQLGTADSITRASPVQIGTSSWNIISAGLSTSMAIRSDGALFAWGSSYANSPVQVGFRSWIAINAISTHYLGIRSDNLLFAWGNNASGQLGTNNLTSSTVSPLQVGSSSWIAVGGGLLFSAAIRSDGALFTWGRNTWGQLGEVDTIDRSSPVQVGISSWITVSAGSNNHLLAIRSDRRLFAWGDNQFGTLGLSDNTHRSSPVQVGTSSWTAITVNNADSIPLSMALRSDGRLFTWGRNADSGNNRTGQLGDGSSSLSRNSPLAIGTSSWIAISAGTSGDAAALLINGSLWTWGNSTPLNPPQTIGDFYTSPYQVGTSSWTVVAYSDQSIVSNVMAIRSDGRLFAWGYNTYGGLGTNSTVDTLSPTQIGTSSWTFVDTASLMTLAIRSDGRLFTWGNSEMAQLGDNTDTPRSSPVQIGTDRWLKAAIIQGGFYNTAHTGSVMAIRADGTLWGWGSNQYGLLGLNDSAISLISPTQVGTSSWTVIDSSGKATHAIRSDGALFAWGENNTGQLGTGDKRPHASPIQIGTSSWSAVASSAAETDHTLAIRSDGALFAWGNNDERQLGVISTVHRSSPVQLGTSSWIAVSAGYKSSYAIRSDGRLFVWGYHSGGALGNNLTGAGSTSSPAQLGTSSWTAVTAAFYQTAAAIRSDGILFVWGYYPAGAGSTLSTSSPVQVGTSSWISIGAGGRDFAAVRVDNTLWAWSNDGSPSTSPVQVGTDTDWLSVTYVYNNEYLARKTDNTLYEGYKETVTQIGTSSWTAIGGGAGAAIFVTNYIQAAIRIDGALFVWGDNERGQLGLGTGFRNSPTQVGTDTDWAELGTTLNRTFAIKKDGSLWGWGSNFNGALGTNDPIYYSSPVKIGTSSWIAISSDQGTFAVRSDKKLFVWGDNSDNILGFSDTVHRSSPVQLGTQNYKGVDTYFDYVKLIRDDGTIFQIGRFEGPSGSTSPVQLGTNNFWSQIAAGNSHSLALTSEGLVYAWGLNSSGQVGDTTTANRSTPVLVTEPYAWSRLFAGNASAAFAVRSDGRLFAWGYNAGGGNLGLNTTQNISSPTPVGTSSWITVGAAETYTAAIRTDGALFAWGLNTRGELGLNDQISRSSPVQIGTSSWIAVSTGGTHALALRIDRTLWSWGANDTGQLGRGFIADKSSPVQLGISSWTVLSGGQNYTLAIRSDSGLFAWGVAAGGAIGLSDSLNRQSPVQVGSSSWTLVAADYFNSFAIRSDGALFAWGTNQFGTIGDSTSGTQTAKSSPVQIGTSSWIAVNIGYFTAFAIRSDGALFAWGYNTAQGNLGDNTVFNSKSSPVPIGTSSWTAVAAGMALRIDGALFTWGSGFRGRLGDGTLENKSSPVQIGTSSWIAIGNRGSYAIRSDGRLFAWGSNDWGQLGDGTTIHRSSPVSIGTSSWTAVSTGLKQTIAIRTDGTLWTWGRNTWGQLGTSDFVSRSSPVQVGTESNWIRISTGSVVFETDDNDTFFIAVNSLGGVYLWGRNDFGQHGDSISWVESPIQIGTSSNWQFITASETKGSAAINDNGQLFTWGGNFYGQLGQNTTLPIGSPTQLGTSSWSVISVESNSTYALRSDGGLFSWGSGANGGLGDETIIHRSSPVQLGTSSWTAVSAGFDCGLALRSDSTIWSWGYNSDGELGVNNTVHRSSPVQIGTSSWIAIDSSQYSGYAIRIDQTLWAWGGNFTGQIGDNTIINRSSPVQIGRYSTAAKNRIFTRIAAGFSHSLALSSDGTLYAWGANSNGQIGETYYPLNNVSTPVLVKYPSWSWTQVTGRGSNSAGAIRSDGALFVWGSNQFGIIGDNSVTSKSSPVQIGISSWTAVSVNGNETKAIRSDGGLFTWGAGFNSAHGNGITSGLSSPVQIGTSSWLAVDTGVYSLAVRTDGGLFVWGSCDQGSGGTGTTNSFSSNSPVQIGTSSWTAIAKSGFTSGAIRSGGSLFVWGQNNIGQLGLGDTAGRSSPVQLGISSWTSLGIGEYHTLAIRSDGALFAWGSNDAGTLGQGTSGRRYSPVLSINNKSWKQIASGGTHVLALEENGTLWSWGINFAGQLGINSGASDNQQSPVQIGSSSWAFISAGLSNSAAIRSDGRLFVWGYNPYGTQGDNTSFSYRSSPVQVGTSSWIAVSISNHALAIRSDGALFVWGYNNHGQLGLGDIVHRSSPVSLGSNSWIAVSVGNIHSLAVRSDGALFSWGGNFSGQLGPNDQINRSSPVQIGSSSWTLISSSNDNSHAIRIDGTLWAWGNNLFSGSLGNGSTSDSKSSPIQIGAASLRWKSVFGFTAGQTIAAITTSNRLYAWGRNQFGEIGNGEKASTQFGQGTPQLIGEQEWKSVSIGGSHAIGIGINGVDLYGWGSNNFGQLGDNKSWIASPVQIGTATDWVSVSAGLYNSIAIKNNGTVWSWGENELGDTQTSANRRGLLGLNDTNSRSSPTQIGASLWTAVSLGADMAIAIRLDGTLFAWGNNQWGNLGNNRSDLAAGVASSPVFVHTRSMMPSENDTGFVALSFTSVAAGGNHNLGIRPNGLLFAWGANNQGQLGVGDFLEKYQPTQVGTSSWTAVSAGASHTLGIGTDGKLYGWGDNNSNQIGPY